jgi:exopolysaccharide biosynthesis protein
VSVLPNETENVTPVDAVPEANTNHAQKRNKVVHGLGVVLKMAVIAVAIVVSVWVLNQMILTAGPGAGATAARVADVAIIDKFDMYMTNQISNALDGVLNIEKVYWISDSDLVAPKPKQENFGTADSPEELMWLLEEAAELIDGQEMMFNADRPVWKKDKIYYYYDETILVITWKEVIRNKVYTISEVKIAHPSQFRRFLADGEFGSDKQYITTDMAKSVNSVVASSGDFYKHRYYGVVVYNGEIKRGEYYAVDTCFIDDQGDLIFSPRMQFENDAQAEQFVEENNIRFSLAFGPILVDNGVACPPGRYKLGEIDGYYSRMALCQRDKLHYLLVNATAEGEAQGRPTIFEFADVIEGFGCEKAYALDGGQTTVIAMNGELITSVDYGYQRQISDIIYFATALPDGE